MTKLSHQIQGGFLSLSLFFLTRNVFSFLFYVGNLLPDVDILWGYGKSGRWYSHRGITHSLLVALFLLLCSFFLSAFEERVGKAFLFFSLGYANHVFFDFLSPTGIPLKLSYYPRIRCPLYRNNSFREALLVLATSLPPFLSSLYLSRDLFKQLTLVVSSCILHN
jgi:membrane-bound metal-dependent hydrolase YbcI (DUF457 family)